MNIIDKFVRSLKDDYKVGVETTARSPVVYLNPDALDQWAVKRIQKLDEDTPLVTREDKMADRILREQIAQQLDEQSPGLSLKYSESEMRGHYRASLELGPFVDPDSKKHGVAIVNMPKNNEMNNDKILETFGLTGTHDHGPEDPNDPYYSEWPDSEPSHTFDSNHIKPLPGSSAIWEELVGQHEGEHVNQEALNNEDGNLALRILDKEVLADRKALATMRANGQEDVAQTFIDIRALAAADGDNTHATGIFLHQVEHKNVTPEQMMAAMTFKDEMVGGVAAELGIRLQAAEDLRKDGKNLCVHWMTPKRMAEYPHLKK